MKTLIDIANIVAKALVNAFGKKTPKNRVAKAKIALKNKTRVETRTGMIKAPEIIFFSRADAITN